MNTALFELRMLQLGIQNADDYTIGMVSDIMTEQGNDQENYPIIADKSDINAFFGRG